MKYLILVAIAVVALANTASADWVNGYYRSNGTYVQGYNRSSRNNTVTDNYSFYGNRNPYTGSIGTNKYTSNPSSPYYGGGLRNYNGGLGSTYGRSNSYGSGLGGGLLNPYGR